MNQTGATMSQQKFDAGVTKVAMNLEVDVIPVSDVERSPCPGVVPNMKSNADGSVDIYFGRKAPAGLESNWIPTQGKRARPPPIRPVAMRDPVNSLPAQSAHSVAR